MDPEKTIAPSATTTNIADQASEAQSIMVENFTSQDLFIFSRPRPLTTVETASMRSRDHTRLFSQWPCRASEIVFSPILVTERKFTGPKIVYYSDEAWHKRKPDFFHSVNVGLKICLPDRATKIWLLYILLAPSAILLAAGHTPQQSFLDQGRWVWTLVSLILYNVFYIEG